VDFEKTKFEIIQKSSKKFMKITEENKKELLEEIEKYNFNKILEEIIKNIVDSKFEFKDVNAMIIILSELNQIYDNFGQKYIEYLKKAINEFNEMINKTPAKNEEEEERRAHRKKGLYRLFIESYLYGLVNDFISVKDLLIQLVSPKKNNAKDTFFNDFSILTSLLKIFGEPLFGFKSKSVKILIESGDIPNYELNTSIQNAEKYYQGFKDYYYKRVLVNLEEENKVSI
jgi:hypothetical protein